MTYDLAIGDMSYSSWSLRGWLCFEKFGIPVRLTHVDFASKEVADQLDAFPTARTVPALRTAEGVVIAESLAIAEEIASREPGAGLWPSDPAARGMARALASEMHSGFGALRNDCPMNLRVAYSDFQPSEDVMSDVARIESVWGQAFDRFGGDWLCGPYSVADAFFAPVAARIAGYGLPVSDRSAAYVARHLADPAFRRWRAMGLVRGETLEWYKKPNRQTPWPGPVPLSAKAVETGTPENAACPYSGKPATHLMEIAGRTFGFCNAFCRDKTVVDPECWPAFMEIHAT